MVLYQHYPHANHFDWIVTKLKNDIVNLQRHKSKEGFGFSVIHSNNLNYTFFLNESVQMAQ